MKYWVAFKRRTILIVFVVLAVMAAAQLATTEAVLGEISRNLPVNPTGIAFITRRFFAFVDLFGAVPT